MQQEIAALQREVAALRQQVQGKRQRFKARMAAGLLAVLIAVVPMSLYAANPFNDLTGGVHDRNIGLIYDAGITKGCVPNASYCPTDLVTRQEMASFLARTAGLGDNPPVVNAKTVPDVSVTTSKLSGAGSTPGQVLVSTGTGVEWRTLGAPPPGTNQPPVAGTEYPAQAGTVATLRGDRTGVTFRVAIDGVQERTQLPGPYGGTTVQTAGGKFVILLVTSTNQGAESSYIKASCFRLRDQQSRFFDVADTGPQRGAEIEFGRKVYYETLQPSFTQQQVIVFDVAPNGSGYSIVTRGC